MKEKIIHSGTCGDGVSWQVNEWEELYVFGDGTMENYSFAGGPWGKDITRAAISPGVKNVGAKAFYCCKKLRKVDIPASVVYIGDSAFSNCYSLSNVVIPGDLEVLEPGVFECCTNLDSVTLPPSLKRIRFSAFKECWKLVSITIPAGLLCADPGAFENCFNLANVLFCTFEPKEKDWENREYLRYNGWLASAIKEQRRNKGSAVPGAFKHFGPIHNDT